MMKKLLFFTLCAFALQTNAQHFAGFDNFTLGTDSFDNGSFGSESFMDQRITCPIIWDTSWGGFWAGGWALSNQTDSTRQGTDGLYQSISGKAYSGQNYLIGQQGSEMYVDNSHTDYIHLKGFYVNNTSYTYYSMRDGDAFAKKFGGNDGTEPDYLILHITGKSQGIWLNDTIDFPLADFRFSDSSQDYIVSEWQFVQTESIYNADTFVFFLTSSDTGQYGINTPSFFAIDNLLQDLGESVSTPTVNSIQVYPNPAHNDLFLGEERSWSIYNVQGQLQLKGRGILADIRSLIPGTYFIIDENGASARFVKQ